MDEGIIGILDAAGINTVDVVSPFLGDLIHTCFGWFDSEPVTTVFTDYVELADIVYKRKQVTDWSKIELREKTDRKGRLQKLGRVVFKNSDHQVWEQISGI